MKTSERLRIVFLLAFPLLCATAQGQYPELQNVRKMFFTMNLTKDGSLILYYRLEHLDLNQNNLLLAYRGAASAASAGAVDGVFNKLKFFLNGKSDLELAIHNKPSDPEIRFLRLATQLNAPAFLGYKGDINNDKKLIINELLSKEQNTANDYLYSRISRFLLDSGLLLPMEKDQLKKWITKN